MILKLPLPPRPDLEDYLRRAEALVEAARAEDPAAVRAWIGDWLKALAALLGRSIGDAEAERFEAVVGALEARVKAMARVDVAEARSFLAGAHGFEGWEALAREVERLDRNDPETRRFESAVDAVVNGDLAALEAVLAADPAIVRARSHRAHEATLLHYVSANGVEDWRQKTPPNALAVATRLLDAGAEVDALAKTYEGGSWETTLNLLVSSTHPAIAGLQGALAELLVARGAAVNGLKDDESPLMTALDFGYGETSETLARCGARVDTVSSAAALGRLELVKELVVDKDTVKPGTPLVAPPWRKLPDRARPHLDLALAWACKFARVPVAQHLLDLGVDHAAADGLKMTALHWAAANGLMGLIDRLIALGAPLEARNQWEGTVLGSTSYFAREIPVAGVDYEAVIDRLVRAGARRAD